MPETTQWPVQAQVQAPLDPATAAAATTAPVGADWTYDLNGTNVMRWGDRNNEAEYWLPDSLDAQVPIFDFPGTNVDRKSVV